MPLTAAQVQRLAPDCSLIQVVDVVPKGHIRIQTGFSYPDGTSIDVFVLRNDTDSPRITLSDLGQSVAWLMGAQVNPWTTKRRQQLLNDAIRPYGVELDGSALRLAVNSEAEVPLAILRLGQASLRVSDILYTRRQILTEAFAESVEEFLVEKELQFRQNVDLDGVSGRPVKVDMLVSGRQSKSALLLLSSSNRASAHPKANEVLRKWFDLDGPHLQVQRVTVYNDRYETYLEEDLHRLGRLSTVVPFSDQETLYNVVAA